MTALDQQRSQQSPDVAVHASDEDLHLCPTLLRAAHGALNCSQTGVACQSIRTILDRLNMPPAAPKLSIGMPVFNGAKWIRDALESLLTQSFEDFELIISDNASTDDT